MVKILRPKRLIKPSEKTATKTPVKSSGFSAPSAPKKEKNSGWKHGIQLGQKEAARREAGYRVMVPVGESRKIIITDGPGEPFFMYEHHYETSPNKWNGFARCIKESSICPACQALGKEGYYVLLLSVIECHAYTDRNGQTVKFSKRLLAVKQSQIPKYFRLYQSCGENLRGVCLTLHRDEKTSPPSFETGFLVKDPKTGKKVRVERMTELQLKAYGEAARPTNYAKAFPLPTEAQLRQQFSVAKPLGSEDLDDDDDNDTTATVWDD